jgi:hypothetical protein
MIDLNMGCPAKEVRGALSGSALMCDLDLAERLVAAAVSATSRPVTLKMRRPGVTEGVHELSDSGLINHSRGTVVVIDREGLIKCANGLYGMPEAECERLLGRSARN